MQKDSKKASKNGTTLNQLGMMISGTLIPISVGIETNSISWGLISVMFIFFLICLKDEVKK